jgi:hypothetical protein
LNTQRVDEETGKAKLRDIIEAEVLEDPEYKKYDLLVREHEKNQGIYKALTEIYSSNVERLSREATMRKDEFDRGR